MEQLFSGITPTVSYKTIGENNPLYTQRFGADPGVMEYNGRVYVYTTNDAFEYDSSGNLQENSYNCQTINCISSADLVNWTDHGVINVAGSSGAATWAWASWAPAPAHKTINGKEKFFLYFANSAGGIGVLTADSPTGPWTDPIGGPIVSSSTANCSDVLWMFDPAVLVDDDGTGYLYFGGGVPDGQAANPKTARVVKLSDDMIHIDGTPQTIDAPYLFEDSGINKINGKYYYSYCTNWNTSGNSYGLQNAQIAYMVSDSPMGPFTYSGVVMENPGALGGGGNNHHFMCTLNGKLYMFYHARSVEDKMGIHLNYRSPMVNEVTISSDGSLSVTPTMAGVSQLTTLNPYEKIQAETIYRQGGINVRNQGDTIVTDIQKGDWISVAGANFTNGAKSITVNVSSTGGGAIKVCTGSENGTVVGYIDVPATGETFTDITAAVSGLSGTQDVYLVFSSEMEIDYWYFS
jgi:arabinoxylan arabinofuranohydrolase